ncbi:hypothetical protein PCH_Pc12g08540 [Penicillium rubens Wisconsin 54-1255]|uniref:Uncharacterized protein n=1 Tax=Penicillium rubens (strain ATCC 28089 / DSM 1075 / NRRL 1951 / Wisconsin 54-1255) TaxID=500485 RepID=B6GYA1_PENRW|nr:hypothetical protein PCH_Pc12g08540 [Penicillium rubens Wisconsin 54-1255]
METPITTLSSTTKFSDFVPALKGEANWEIWKQYVEIGLNGIDSTFWPIFVGDNKRPPNLPGMEDEVFEDTVTEIDDDTPASDFVLASGFTPTSAPTPAPVPASDPGLRYLLGS